MSRTDKHRPLWVQVSDEENRWFMQEEHDHRDGVCDLGRKVRSNKDLWPWNGRCFYDVSYYGWNNGVTPRPPKGHWDRQGKHGVLRMRWRRTRQQLLKACDVDDVDVYGPPRREYKRWQWNSGW